MLGYGNIICSSVFPVGYILIVSSVKGEQLAGLWDQLNFEEKDHIRQECRKAISVLRSFHIWLADAGKHNVIYSKDSKAVTLIDFESIGDCTGEEDTLDAPELLAIFGRAANDARCRAYYGMRATPKRTLGFAFIRWGSHSFYASCPALPLKPRFHSL